ncbi:MAG: ATP-binding protein [Terracidiphilus sp.]
MARQLHETPFREVPGASVAIGHQVEEDFSDSPSERWLSRVLRGMHRVIDKGRVVLEGVRSTNVQSTGLERALCDLLSNIAPTAGTQLRIIVTGRPKTLESAIQEQIYLIGREALLNALHHSEATSIEAELEYSARRLRVVIRDNGCGIEPNALQPGRSSHCGLRGMFERAKAMGARFRILSKSGSGTEVELSLPFDSRGKSVLNP